MFLSRLIKCFLLSFIIIYAIFKSSTVCMMFPLWTEGPSALSFSPLFLTDDTNASIAKFFINLTQAKPNCVSFLCCRRLHNLTFFVYCLVQTYPTPDMFLLHTFAKHGAPWGHSALCLWRGRYEM